MLLLISACSSAHLDACSSFVSVCSGVRIDGPTVIKNASIGDGARIGAFSHIEQSTMAPNSGIGPFARVRGGAAVGAGAYIGNFCELKNASVGAGGNVCHLSYLGDAELAENVNIGAGTITCNFSASLKCSSSPTQFHVPRLQGSPQPLVAPISCAQWQPVHLLGWQ